MTPEDEAAEYYMRTAQAAMRHHGLNSEHCAKLAAWARSAGKAGHKERGVIVSGDGRLWAETVHPPTPVLDASGRGQVPRPPWRINPATWPGGNPPEGRRALGEAMDAVRDRTGQPVAHIVYGEVCTGWIGMWGPQDREWPHRTTRSRP